MGFVIQIYLVSAFYMAECVLGTKDTKMKNTGILIQQRKVNM